MMMFASVFGRGCRAGKGGKTVDSVESMTLTLHGMRGTNIYEITEKDGKTELCRFTRVYSNGKDVRRLEKSVICDTESFVELVNNCGIISWDGFHGKHPKNVRDGIMFDFSATVNGGQKIHADGSENFPKGYREFVCELDKILTESEQRSM